MDPWTHEPIWGVAFLCLYFTGPCLQRKGRGAVLMTGGFSTPAPPPPTRSPARCSIASADRGGGTAMSRAYTKMTASSSRPQDGGELGQDLGDHPGLALADEHPHQRRHPRVQLLLLGACSVSVPAGQQRAGVACGLAQRARARTRRPARPRTPWRRGWSGWPRRTTPSARATGAAR